MERLTKSKVEPGRVGVQWLGQSGFALKAHGGDVLVVDPYLSDSANAGGGAARLVDIPVRPKEVRLDYLFLTHDHVDHTDPQTAPVIAQTNPNALMICPPSACRHLTKLGVPASQITVAMPGQTLEFPNFAVYVVAAQHTEDSVGFVFEFQNNGSSADTVSVYHTGDTEYTDTLARAVEAYAPEVLLVPINGRWGNMDAAQAAKLAAEIAPREVIPMHYGMFAENTADPDEFVSFLASATNSSPDIIAVVLKHNSCHTYCPEDAVQGKHAKTEARAARAKAARTRTASAPPAPAADLLFGFHVGAGRLACPIFCRRRDIKMENVYDLQIARTNRNLIPRTAYSTTYFNSLVFLASAWLL